MRKSTQVCERPTRRARRFLSPDSFYDRAPRFLQRGLVNLEAYRRDRFRRYGRYESELKYYEPFWYRRDLELQQAHQLERLNILLKAARRHVPYYRATLPAKRLDTLQDLRYLPILEKQAIASNPLSFVREGIPLRRLWLSTTSGSTGTPLRFYHDGRITRAHQAVCDSLLATYGCPFGERRVRISGVQVVPYSRSRPPFWIYIDRHRQLQCSACHLGPDTYRCYLQVMRKYKVSYATGYATAWHLLSMHLLESGESPPRLKAIFTDSEGLGPEQQAMVEMAFGCPVFQTYGTGEVGQVAAQCREKRYHVLTRACIIEILDDKDKPVPTGECGHVVVTDLTGLRTPFIRYRTGDLATPGVDGCACGWRSPCLDEIVGRLDDRILTPESRWVRIGGHIMRPAVGVRESQIIQKAIDRIVILVVPDSSFQPAKMDAVLERVHRYLGDSMKVSWERTDRLQRTRAGKLRHVVREIDV